MSVLWSPVVHRLTPYVPGEQRSGDGIVKLNTNENPYPPSSRVLDAIASVQGHSLRRYPSPESDRLREAIGQHHDVPVEQVFVGNGSDEILALAYLAFFGGRAALQYPVPSYSFYPVYCGLFGIEARPLELGAGFTLALGDFATSTDRAAGGIIFPNPNAPTGLSVPARDIESLARRHAGVVLVDEAYADFGAESAVALTATCPNVVVSRTFSKGRSLAGLRLGYAIAAPELIDGLRRVKNSFNSYPVDALAEAAGVASLQDDESYRDAVARIVATREDLARALQDRGFTVLPSAANFVFVKPPGGEAQGLARHLATKGILVRHWSTPGIEQWLRISIGTDVDMQQLLAAIDTAPTA